MNANKSRFEPRLRNTRERGAVDFSSVHNAWHFNLMSSNYRPFVHVLTHRTSVNTNARTSRPLCNKHRAVSVLNLCSMITNANNGPPRFHAVTIDDGIIILIRNEPKIHVAVLVRTPAATVRNLVFHGGAQLASFSRREIEIARHRRFSLHRG